MKTNTNAPVATGSHNTLSLTLLQCLDTACIQSEQLIHFLHFSITRPAPRHDSLQKAIQYKIQVIQAERLLFLLTAA
jgi:hypothetical protein